MRPKAILKQLDPLLKAPSFTSREAASLGVNTSVLAHYIKRGDLERMGRGVYRFVGAPSIENFRFEDLVSAVQTVKDGVICLTSALALYGLTEEIPRQHWIAIRNNTRHRAPSIIKVVRMRNLDLGKSKIKMSGLSIPIFDRERTIVDSFRYLSVETAIKALRMGLTKRGVDKINLEKLQKYAKALRVDIRPYLLAVTT
jgi:predicted transcriptional regulator of viral defense system